MPSMPRKARNIDPNAAIAIAKIKRYCETNGVSVLALSKSANVAQSALARFINGERKSITPAAKFTLTWIDNRHNQHNWHNELVHNDSTDSHGCRIIGDAINSLWDGRLQSAEVIASLVLALRPAIDILIGQKSGGDKE